MWGYEPAPAGKDSGWITPTIATDAALASAPPLFASSTVGDIAYRNDVPWQSAGRKRSAGTPHFLCHEQRPATSTNRLHSWVRCSGRRRPYDRPDRSARPGSRAHAARASESASLASGQAPFVPVIRRDTPWRQLSQVRQTGLNSSRPDRSARDQSLDAITDAGSFPDGNQTERTLTHASCGCECEFAQQARILG